jgi:hypothetical protein
MTFSYTNPAVPDDYKCGTCGATGCKLWREYQAFMPSIECCDCAGKSQGKDVSQINAEGMRPCEGSGLTDSIGWRVPAVPTLDNTGWWGYTSVPQDGVRWWTALPTRSEIRSLDAEPAKP